MNIILFIFYNNQNTKYHPKCLCKVQKYKYMQQAILLMVGTKSAMANVVGTCTHVKLCLIWKGKTSILDEMGWGRQCTIVHFSLLF